MRKRRTRAKASFVAGRVVSRRTFPSWFLKAVDGHTLSLGFPLQEQLVEHTLMFLVRNAETASFFPEQKLFGASEEGIS